MESSDAFISVKLWVGYSCNRPAHPADVKKLAAQMGVTIDCDGYHPDVEYLQGHVVDLTQINQAPSAELDELARLNQYNALDKIRDECNKYGVAFKYDEDFFGFYRMVIVKVPTLGLPDDCTLSSENSKLDVLSHDEFMLIDN